MTIDTGTVMDIGTFHEFSLPQGPVVNLCPQISSKGLGAVYTFTVTEEAGILAIDAIKTHNGDIVMA